jgi:hypothetical protein
MDDFGAPGQRYLSQGTGPNGLAREGILIFWYPVPGSRVPCTRPRGARYGGIVVTSTENVDFWYRYVGPVATGTEIVDFGYPKYRYFGAFGTPKM